MRKILIAALLAFAAAAPASAQTATPGVNPNVNANVNVGRNNLDTSRVPNLRCADPSSRACAQDQRQAPQQRTSASTRPSGGQGGGPRPTRRP